MVFMVPQRWLCLPSNLLNLEKAGVLMNRMPKIVFWSDKRWSSQYPFSHIFQCVRCLAVEPEAGISVPHGASHKKMGYVLQVKGVDLLQHSGLYIQWIKPNVLKPCHFCWCWLDCVLNHSMVSASIGTWLCLKRTFTIWTLQTVQLQLASSTIPENRTNGDLIWDISYPGTVHSLPLALSPWDGWTATPRIPQPAWQFYRATHLAVPVWKMLFKIYI